MERFEIQDNQFIKKNVISSLPKLPQIIDKLLNNWSSNQIGKSGKYEEKLDGSSAEPCGIAEHYLCQYYRTEINPQETQKTKNKKNVQAPQTYNYNYADLIVGFLNEGDVLYALTIANIILRVARKARNIAQSQSQIVENNLDLDEFILKLDELRYNIEHDADLFQNVRRNEDSKLDGVRKKINKVLIYKIDGVTALTKEIGTDTFIKYAIDQCYFFDPIVVNNQMGEIVKAFTAKDENEQPKPKELPARHSTKNSVSEEDSNQEDFGELDILINNNSYYHDIDYYRTALAAIESAKKTSKGSAQKKDDIIKDALALATLAITKINDCDKEKENEAIKKAEEEMGKALDEITINYKEIKQKDVQQCLEDKKNKLEEKLKDSKYCLFTSKEEGKTIDNYPILIDNDGNAKVRSLINDTTCYTVSAGKENIFQNYRISHVWGRAFDPRYFTNLWNIVLVPSWANDLLDKPNARPRTLESKLQSTIMRICEVLYFDGIKERDWNTLKLSNKPSVINGGKDVVKPSNEVKGIKPYKTIPKAQENDVPYMINVIKGKKSDKKRDNELGDIVKYAVYI